MSSQDSFKLTYATMFNPPEALHTQFEDAIKDIRDNLGKEYGMMINGQDYLAAEKMDNRTPINTDTVLAVFQKGSAQDGQKAIAAAKNAFEKWSHTPWQERIKLVRKAADLIDERIYKIGAAMTLEVGKNRMESLGDVAETADLMRYACDQMEINKGYRVEMGHDPLSGYYATNYSVLKPHGVWVVISPFNFPAALTGGPVGAALVAGNTVVFKPASDTPWVPRLYAECLRDAGIPDGVFNYVTGSGGTIGQALIDSPDVGGITFTGSFNVGMGIYKAYANGQWVRPIILELGGKNPVIVSKNADLDTAAMGIVRSAFGLQGQKCSAASRIYAEAPVYKDLLERVLDLTRKLTIGDPSERSITLGPVVNKSSYRDYQEFTADLAKNGKIAIGGKVLTDGEMAKGYFCAPTVVTDLPLEHKLWRHEMFLPITCMAQIGSLEEGMKLANDIGYGLTSGFYGNEEEAQWYFDKIEAGVNYVNRPQGATTGAWPGFQPFGGWKGSGATGKNAGGPYYLPLYMREQIQTLIKKI